MIIGILSAMPFEKEGILGAMKQINVKEICKIDFTSGIIGNTPVVVAACGEGKVNAARCAQIMADHYSVNAIINVGVAGSMSSEIGRGELIVANRVIQYDFDMTAIGVPLGMIPRGTRSTDMPWGEEAKIYIDCSDKLVDHICKSLNRMKLKYHIGQIATGDLFVADIERKNSILKSFDVLACEMEGAAVGYVCDSAGIDFAEIRDISDNADDAAEESYFSYRKQYNLAQIICEILNDFEE